jgi:sodium/proline symporter
VSYAWAGLGASLGPVVLFSLYYKKMTEISAILSIFFGGVLVLVWDLFSGGIFSLYSLVPGFIFSSLSIILLSNMFPKKHNSQS